ncbi:MAG: EMC3/TMCO1 family protein [Candidatus Bathyarchaeota archaeon]|nr:EMC3/TMCO1 family protein [Candidatus Termiticorpusculum sp.]
MSAAEWVTALPVATVVIMATAFIVSVINMSINRALLSHFIGWDKYRTMQKEMAEFRKESMAAARSNDKKQLEKLKKRQSQINAMQQQMFKPQMIQMALVLIYFPVWIFFLTPTFGNKPVALLPVGDGYYQLPLFLWYMISSLFLGTVMQRVLGTLPIE